MASPLLRVDGLRVGVSTAGGVLDAVRGVDFEVHRGEALGMVGESGSGKTLTCRAILGVLPDGCEVTGGSIELDGEDLAHLDRRGWSRVRGVRIGAVFQDPASYLNPSLPVGEQLSEVLRVRGGLGRKAAHARALELLDLMGLRNPRRVYEQVTSELSGGMLQRVMIAIAVSCDPDLLVADEATTSLDLTTQREVIGLLNELRERLGLAVVFVSHDLAAVAELCDRVAVFYAGEIVEAGPIAEVVARPVHPYTEALLRVAAMKVDGRGELDVIPGHHPRLGEHVAGCRFAPRCAYRVQECSARRVHLTELADGLTARCIRVEDLVLAGEALA
jgi:peptide/nickel transport system ATP-binding protein